MKKLLLLFTLILSLTTTAQEIKFGKVSKEALEEKFYPLDSTADAAYLFKKRKTHFVYSNNGFKVVTEYHERIKIYSKEGFSYANKTINYYKPDSGNKEEINSLKAYSFNLEKGKTIKHKISKKEIFSEKLNKYRSIKKFTLPNIKEGSVIDIKYTLVSHQWDIKTLNFQYGIPVKFLDYKVEIPEYFFFNLKNKGHFNIPPKKTNKQGEINWTTRERTLKRGAVGSSVTSEVNNHKKTFKVNCFSFLGSNIPYIKENEPYLGNINNYKGGYEFELSGTRFPNSLYKNYTTNWEDVCKTIYESSNFGNELEKEKYYKKEITSLVGSAMNELEKIVKIFEFTKSKIKWNGYYGKYADKGLKKAYKEESGNVAEINLALTSMLRSVGLKSNPVLVSTKGNGIPLFPTREGFNYVISKVNLSNGKYLLLDATEKYSTINDLPLRAINWKGREITENGQSNWVNLTPSLHAKENNILHAKLDSSGSIEGLLRKSLTRHSAMFYRQKNNHIKEEEIILSLEEKYNIEIEDFKISNKKNISNPISQTLKFSGEDFIEEINGKLYFSPLLFLATKENPFKSKERNFPVDYRMPWQDKFVIAITTPEGYLVESFPKELAIGLPENLGFFKYKILVLDNKIKLSSVLQINSSIITPQYYTALRDFYTQLVKKQSEKIVLIKK